MKLKKLFALTMMVCLGLTLLAGCGGDGDGAGVTSGAISPISREDGSGTRGAFVELFGIEQKDAEGNKVDMTTQMAEITSSTSVMMTTVAGNPRAIGYISLGSMSDTVKALEIDGAAASVENIKNGTYAIARPFNIAAKQPVSEAAGDFIAFILSEQGQAVIEEGGYISQGSAGAYTPAVTTGSITVAGSSSVAPIMEKLKEAYNALNPGVEIAIQQSDSTTGVNSVIEGICDIGMASRELKESELAAGLSANVIAMDGIAVIVNHENILDGLTTQQVCDIFTGAVTDWSELQ